MTRQKKDKTYAASTLWRDGTSARPLPAGVVARGDLKWDDETRTPPAVDLALVERGRQRYEIFCLPCHGATGDGRGVVVERGFPKPPSLGDSRLRQASAQHMFDVITNGVGAMYPYAAQTTPHDRWAIVAYLRALQLAADASVAQAPQATEKAP